MDPMNLSAYSFVRLLLIVKLALCTAPSLLIGRAISAFFAENFPELLNVQPCIGLPLAEIISSLIALQELPNH
jgi:hypothetical protein